MPEGVILRNCYRLDQLLGRGGMAEVYLAFDLRRQVHVAVKLLREDLAGDTDFVRRFEREADALARLDHPNIVRFYSFERQGASAFIVMDFVPGISLRRRLADADGPLPLDEVTRVVRHIGSALQYAHHEGYIHRDIKPGNIMIRQDGTALLSDFGIARAVESVTMTVGPVGTPAYMSPEQILGKEVDPRTDIYSFGIVLYEAVTGRRPFTGETGTGTSTIERIRDEHLHQAPPDPRRYNRALLPDVAEVIQRCMTKPPDQRWPDMASLVKAWEAAVGPIGDAAPELPLSIAGAGRPRVGPPTPVEAGAKQPAASPPLAWAGPPPGYAPAAPAKRISTPLVALLGVVAVLVVALTVVGFLALRTASDRKAATPLPLATPVGARLSGPEVVAPPPISGVGTPAAGTPGIASTNTPGAPSGAGAITTGTPDRPALATPVPKKTQNRVYMPLMLRKARR